jgi:hypothetical protein
MKDRVSNGDFIMKVSVLDRLGGNNLPRVPKDTEKEYIDLSKKIDKYNYKKLKFLNKVHREVEEKKEDGTTSI